MIREKITIPPLLADQLQHRKCFCLVEANGKNPSIGGKGWNKLENLMEAHDERLVNHLDGGGNYGIVGGYGLIIIDLDHPDLNEIVNRLPQTFTVQSGSGGIHLYFWCSLEKPIRLRDKNGENIGDIQSSGKMVVGPNSIHPNGNPYKIINQQHIAQITSKQLREAFKEYIVPDTVITAVEETAKWERDKSNIDLSISNVVPLMNLHRQGDEYYGPHPIHGSSTGRNFWVNPKKNTWFCFRHNSGGGPISWLAVQEGVIDCAEATKGGLRGDRFTETLLIAQKRGFIPSPTNENTRQTDSRKDSSINASDFFNQQKKFIPKLLGDHILQTHRFIATSEKSDIWTYSEDKGIWEPNGIEKIQGLASKLLGESYRPYHITAVEKYIRQTNYVDFQLGGPKNKIVMKNGVYNLDTDTLEPYDPELHAITQIPIIYNPTAQCPKILNFLSEIVEEQNISTLVELAGYCLYKDYPIARLFFLEGDGANGKTTFQNLLITFLGPENVSSVSLQKITEEGFRSAELHGKLANICGDIPAQPIKDSGTLKKITGKDRITAEKKFRDPFQFHNYTKPIFSANQIPQTYDDTPAFHRRVIIINFPNTFHADDPNTDPYILDKISSPEELSGFFNLVMNGLKKILTAGKFTNETTVEERKMEYIRKSNPIQYFAITCIEKDLDIPFISNSDLYNSYVKLCEELNEIPKANNVFSREIQRYLPYTHKTTRRINGQKTKGWKGLKIGNGGTDEQRFLPILKNKYYS